MIHCSAISIVLQFHALPSFSANLTLRESQNRNQNDIPDDPVFNPWKVRATHVDWCSYYKGLL